MKRRIAAWILLLCLLQTTALADLKRGSSGEEVVQMQQQMIDIGVLQDEADGKFGRKTEQAVKELQGYFGMKKTGKANQAFLDELSIMWYTMQEEEISSEQYSEEEMEELHLACYPTETVVEYCPRHEFLHYLEGLLKVNGRTAPSGFQCRIYQRIAILGYREILTMYDVWEEKLTDSRKHIAREEKEKFVSGFESVFGNAENYKIEKPWLISLQTWEDMRNWIMLSLVNLCDDLYGRALWIEE